MWLEVSLEASGFNSQSVVVGGLEVSEVGFRGFGCWALWVCGFGGLGVWGVGAEFVVLGTLYGRFKDAINVKVSRGHVVI